MGSAEEAAEALRPVAGELAFALFSFGVIGTGLLSLPVLAGSAAYAFGEAQGWKCGLDNKPWEAAGFYGVIAAATLLGIGIGFSPLDPMRALFWSAVINGFVAVPIMAAMMWLAGRRDQMGRYKVSPSILWLVSHRTDGSCGAFYAGFLMECALLTQMPFGSNGKIALRSPLERDGIANRVGEMSTLQGGKAWRREAQRSAAVSAGHKPFWKLIFAYRYGLSQPRLLHRGTPVWPPRQGTKRPGTYRVQ